MSLKPGAWVVASVGALLLGGALACTSFDSSPTNEPDGAIAPTPTVSPEGGESSFPPVMGTPCAPDLSFLDVPGNKVDEDCSGKADDDVVACDSSLVISSVDPLEAAKALGLCRRADATGKAWGVIDAHYVKPDGSPLGAAPAVSWGVLPSFGAASPISGAAMIALSSGAARASNQANYVAPTGGLDKTYSHSLPAGFPKPMPACNGLPLANAVYDGIALEVHLRAPINAKSLSFAVPVHG